MAHYFLYYSVIVSRQPPSVIVKCGEAENHRRSRFWFNTEIRVLGGQAFGVEAGEGNDVKCYLITDDTAKQLLNNAYLEIFESEEFCIEPPSAVFQKKDTRGLRAKFDDMVRHPLSDIPSHVPCTEMADALEMKFQAIVETPQKNTDGPAVVQPRMFTMQVVLIYIYGYILCANGY
ncbi:hypothetical protein OESDEN_15840 [Oesophagostomum dentatum]|uniref:Uncharacterized protein n=1 Tax=Oesophagostomum dentatum TaxID=61180 RepID=A0A0B1SKM7_OESDE|nr:hypothetical protein OESDEN_15840 [Oesophagostomum dentatum]